jgi:hypothetical protein
MPKLFKTYDRFDGGLNTKTNSRSIQDNELAYAKNVMFDEFGLIKNGSYFEDNTTDYVAPSITASQPGYGLFQASFDFSSGGINKATARTFLADADDGSGNAVVHILDGVAWDTDDISLGANTGSNQAQVIYHIADGTVTTCDTNLANVSTTIKNYKYKKGESKWRGSTGSSIMTAYNAGWKSYDTKLSPPTSGICGDQVAGTTAGSGNNTTTLIAVDSDAFEDFNTQLDLGTYWAVRAGADTELITNRSSDTQLTMPGGGSTWGNSQLYYIYPPLGTGFTLDFTVASGGSWPAGTYEFATTFVYDGNQESLLRKISGDMTVTANDKVTCRVAVVENNDGTGYSLDITGGRIYCKIKDSDDAWVLFGDISFKGHSNKGGSRSSLDGDYTYWSSAVGGTDNSYLYTTFISESLSVETYESINGFSPDSAFNSIGAAGEKYQTSVVTNRRAFVANVQYTTDGGNLQNFGDQIRYSEINKFSTFPPFNFIDIGVNDGEEFVKLEAFADRLLAFKEKTLYIINIGGGSDTQWFLESEHKNMGVLFHAAVVKTDFGVAWANPNGLFFYDGSKVRNLQTKIKEEDWKVIFSPSFYAQSFVDTTCAYNNDPTIVMTSTARVIPGMLVSGSGIPTGSTVSSVTDATDFELSASTTGGAKTSQTLTFHANKTIISYEPTNRHLLIISDCSGTLTSSTITYIYSFTTDTFSYNSAIASGDVLTNPIIDYKNNVALGVALDEIETYDGESNVTTTILYLKNDDFGLPDVVKKIYGITVEYSTGATQSGGLLYRTTDSSGTSSSSFVGTDLSNSAQLDDTSNDLDVLRFTFSSPISVASLQLRLAFGSVETHTVNRVSVEYRPTYKRIT